MNLQNYLVDKFIVKTPSVFLLLEIALFYSTFLAFCVITTTITSPSLYVLCCGLVVLSLLFITIKYLKTCPISLSLVLVALTFFAVLSYLAFYQSLFPFQEFNQNISNAFLETAYATFPQDGTLNYDYPAFLCSVITSRSIQILFFANGLAFGCLFLKRKQSKLPILSCALFQKNTQKTG